MERVTMEKVAQWKSQYSNSKYPVPKWIKFCAVMLSYGWQISLHRAVTTHSKYIYATKNGRTYKIRFSNHKPAFMKQELGDSDFYVGVSHFGCITTEALIDTLLEKEG